MKFFVSLSSKTALFSSIMVFVATSMIAIIVFYSSKAFFLESSIDSLSSEATLLSVEIQNSFERVTKDLFFLANTPPIQGIVRSYKNNGVDVEDASNLEGWKKRLSVIFRSMLEVNPNYTQLRYIGIADEGKEIVRLDRSRYNIYKINDRSLQKKASRPYFKKGIQVAQGSIIFSDVTYNRENGKLQYPLVPTLRVLKSIYDDSTGRVFGLLVINLNYEQFLRRILLNSLSEHNLILYNSQGDFFEYNSEYKTLKFTKSDDVNQAGKTRSIDTMIAGLKKDRDKVSVSRSIYLMKGTNQKVLTLMIAINKSELFKYDKVIINNIIMLIFIISVIAIGLTFFFSRWLMRNLRNMTVLIQSSKVNHKHDEFPTQLHDEVGVLARAFLKKTKLLNKLALYDNLTGLPNRKNLMDYLKKALQRAKRNKTLLAVCFVDLNNFKQVNVFWSN